MPLVCMGKLSKEFPWSYCKRSQHLFLEHLLFWPRNNLQFSQYQGFEELHPKTSETGIGMRDNSNKSNKLWASSSLYTWSLSNLTNLNECCWIWAKVKEVLDRIHNLQTKMHILMLQKCRNFAFVCACVCVRPGSITPSSWRISFGSNFAIQPTRHPGTIHLFESEPIVITGVIDPKAPIDTNGESPYTRWP